MADAQMRIGVVIECRETGNQWQPQNWQPVGIIVQQDATTDWCLLRRGEGWSHYHAGTLDLELFRGETEGYMHNLAQTPPQIFVVLREGEDAGDMDVQPFLATVCPHEAMAYYESHGENVGAVPMPPEVVAWLAAFVDQHHTAEPFRKRKNRRAEGERRGTRPRGQFTEDGA